MEITLAWHELLSWAAALISATLYLVERRKDGNIKYYMVLQGLLHACRQHAGFVANRTAKLEAGTGNVSREEVGLFIQCEHANAIQFRRTWRWGQGRRTCESRYHGCSSDSWGGTWPTAK